MDYGRSRNLALTSVVFVTGLSGIAVKFGDIQLTGMVLASVVAMILSLLFFLLDKAELTNDGIWKNQGRKTKSKEKYALPIPRQGVFCVHRTMYICLVL